MFKKLDKVAMLAHDYEKHGHKINYPAFIQPKLDGIRCIAIRDDAGVSLFTRSGESINSVPHIVEALKGIMSNGDVLDGELYNHDAGFDKLSGDIRSQDNRDTRYIEYHIYDHPVVLNDRDYKQHERVIQLQQYQDNGKMIKPLALVETFSVSDEEDMKKGLEYYISEGYEGVMVRCPNGTYGFGKRSNQLQKVKKFFEDEYEILDMVEGKGKLAGHVGKFVCKMADGKEFSCTCPGDYSQKKKFFEEWPSSKGAMLTVKYQELTKSGTPRFGTGKGIRWDK